MEPQPCDHSILTKEEDEIVLYFKEKFLKIHMPEPASVKGFPDGFITLVKEGSDVYNKLMVETQKLRKIRKFLNHYDPATGRIYILESEYNLRTFLHEFLHACSIYSIDEVRNAYMGIYGIKFGNDLFDGQTEFLTGLILYHFFKTCYEAFRRPSYYYDSEEMKILGYAYHEWTKIWLSIAMHYGIEPVVASYFYSCVQDFKAVQQAYKNAGFYFLFQNRNKDQIHVKLETKFPDHKNRVETPETLDYSLLFSKP